MGRFSGHCGLRVRKQNEEFLRNTGRRRAPPPEFFPRKAPSAADLGIPTAPSDPEVLADEETIDPAQQAEEERRWTEFASNPPESANKPSAPRKNPADWPMLVKNPSTVRWDDTEKMAADTIHEAPIRVARSMCASPDLLLQESAKVLREEDIPFSKFTPLQGRTLLAGRKMEPYSFAKHGSKKGYAKGWCLPQEAKQVLRPILESSLNDTCSGLPKLRYRSRWQRRAVMRMMRYAREYDFTAYFDQFEIEVEFRGHFVVRFKEAIDGVHLFVLTRLPMGARWSPSVAQAVTWLLVDPVRTRFAATTSVDTMLDNVRIASSNRADFDAACQLFEERCAEAGVQLNPQAERLDDDEFVFLGEKYSKDTNRGFGFEVSNSARNVEKLRAAWSRLVDASHKQSTVACPVTARQLASIIGLALFMAHTINRPIRQHPSLMRSYASIISAANGEGSWDEPLPFIARSVIRDLSHLVEPLLENKAVPLPTMEQPPMNDDAYEFIVVIDASKCGFGATVRHTPSGKMFTLQQRWKSLMQHSAHAEPLAVSTVLGWLYENYDALTEEWGAPPPDVRYRIAIVTDHEAMARGQNRWDSMFGGYSGAHFLNNAFRSMYDYGWKTEVFFVEGFANISDYISRNFPTRCNDFKVKVGCYDGLFPGLSEYNHPYALGSRERPDYMV